MADLLHSRNRLLAALPAEILSGLRPHLTLVELEQHQRLYRANGPIDAVFFAEAGVISMVAGLEDGGQAEVGLVGREGMLGLSLMAGISTSFVDAVVQISGVAWRMNGNTFRQEVEADAPFRSLLLRYNEALHAQVMQTAACNGRHPLEARLSRWLLMCHDRADGDDLPLTQEFIAAMLGVHRPSVTVAAGILQRAGYIRRGSGRIHVLDRRSLEQAVCECYAAVQQRFNALFGSQGIQE